MRQYEVRFLSPQITGGYRDGLHLVEAPTRGRAISITCHELGLNVDLIMSAKQVQLGPDGHRIITG